MSAILGVWKINGNGFEGDLNIKNVDAQGKINGTVYGNPIQGFFDNVSGKITFQRVIQSNDPAQNQVFSGYFFPTPPGDGATFYGLAGTFEAFAGTGGTAQKSSFGWFARIDVIH